MILYSVTVSIDPTVAEDWLDWMRKVHIPEVMATNCFVESRLSQILVEPENGISYSVMYVCQSQELMDEYNSKHAPRLQKDHSQRYDGRFAAFRTLLNVIEEFK
ncbi:MAG: DUF4286 family protein [Flavobacteriales bacterium]|jgi:hypothetical protein|nr:DUF4286 family protein [Crocinitomicaceae bacterium]NBX79699.1 DUF4286 family protein [Flavobacteriales bacterium]NCA19646.1 DUF4286 family protein [Crocinitomicaceae bacterium]